MKLLLIVCLSLLCTYCSSAQEAERIGILVLAHGGSPTWQDAVHEAIQPLQAKYPVEVAFGMADPVTIQLGFDTLRKKSVTFVVVVPLFISTHSPIIRQTEYLLGIRKELADEPMMDHNHGQTASGTNDHQHPHAQESHLESTKVEGMKLQPLDIKQTVVMTKALDDHPLVAEILYDRVGELSRQSENETIVLVAHGPNDESDNQCWIQTMENLSDQLRALFTQKEGKKFKNIFCLTVRDDADTAIYEQAREHLRNVVRQAGKDGKVLVIPLFLSHGGVDRDIVTRLEGLGYEWSGKTLLPHSNITKFIELSISDAPRKTSPTLEKNKRLKRTAANRQQRTGR